MIFSVPALYLASTGRRCEGALRCFYCGADCDDSRPSSRYVKGSFTGRDGVFAPGSPSVCGGCVLCLDESATITLIDGETRTGQLTRGYSWVMDTSSARAATKAHLSILRSVCLSPPGAPYAICLSDSGQKHLLYRGVVNQGDSTIVVTLEGEKIRFRAADLASRIELCGHLIAANGKPALKSPVETRFAMAVLGRYRDGESLLAEWGRVREQPLSRLAAWLAPAKEESLLAYPSDITTF